MSLYIDTSAFLKLLIVEPESAKTSKIIGGEHQVVVSSLTRLEAFIQVQRRMAAGMITADVAARLTEQIKALLQSAPFESRDCPADLIAVAENQIVAPLIYCPTLDRLHLAAMEVFELRRLLTNDEAQAAAARALGFGVILPR